MSVADAFAGKWTYRSFHNNPELDAEFNALEFGRAILDVQPEDPLGVAGSIGGSGWSLAIKGRVDFGSPPSIRFQGKGDIGGETWVYDYYGFLAPAWPNGDGQRPAIVGTIVRTVPHSNGQAEAGYVASWIAVRQD